MGNMVILVLLTLALAVSCISFSISITSIFAPVRNWLEKRSGKLGELVHCPWCLSHYVALAILFFVDSYVPATSYVVLNFIITWFAIICMSGIFHFVLLRTYEPVQRAEMRRKMNKK